MYILGLDPSLQKAGYVILDIDAPYNEVKEKGLLKTSPKDGILVQRLIKQTAQIEDKIKKYDISFIGMEAPFFESFNTERLYALNQFLHKMFLERECYVVAFPPQQLKKLVYPKESVNNIHKPHMIDRAKTVLGLHGKILAEDVADAYWAGYFGKRFYHWHIQGDLPYNELGIYEQSVFAGKHEYKRGPKKGIIDYTGIIYRENDLFFDFKAIKRRHINATKKENSHKKKSGSRNKSRK